MRTLPLTPPPALILAAGASRRLGRPKQLETLEPEERHGERLLERAVRVVHESGCQPVYVVLGGNAVQVQAGCDLHGVRCIRNPEWESGMSSSLRAGLDCLAPDVPGVLVVACDQPAVTAVHLRRLWQTGAAGEGPVASSYAGRRGVPAWFPAEHFAALRALTGDQGARNLLRDARTVELPGGELDVDTEESLEAARAWVLRHRGA